MDFINFHIAYLLTKHKCVIIPDFGAFVVSIVQDGKLENRKFVSLPINYSLTFNPEIIQDDELLVHSIAKGKNISYEEALHLVYEYVDNLVDNLRSGQTVQFPWIGKIHLSGDRKIIFTQAKKLSCNASSYGLVNLYFPYLTETLGNGSIEKRKKIYKRPFFYIIFVVIVLLSALLSVFLISKPLNKNRFSFPNKLTMSDMLKVVPKKPTIDSIPLVISDSVKPEIIDSVKPIAIDSTKLHPKYFIIISSLTKEKDAEIMLKYFLSKGLDKSKINRLEGKYRISIETFDDKEEAVSFLKMFKKGGGDPLFKEAWIFEDKGSNHP
jgi:nucleoid DNA-binding protein